MHFHLRVAEDESRGRVPNFNDADEGAVFVQAGDKVIDVIGVGDVDVIGAEGEEFRLAHELLGGLHNLGGEGGGEHAGVDAAFGQVALHLFHVRVKAHREHPVGLVENEHFEMFERERAPEEVIQHPAGGADDDLHTAFERVHLRTVADAAVDRDRAEAGACKQCFGGLGDLFGEFARGDEDEGLALIPPGVEQLQHGEDERARFAAPRAGLDHHVLFGKEIGDGAGLDGGEERPVGVFGGGLQARGKLLEGDFGQGIRGCCGWVFDESIQKRLDSVKGKFSLIDRLMPSQNEGQQTVHLLCGRTAIQGVQLHSHQETWCPMTRAP